MIAVLFALATGCDTTDGNEGRDGSPDLAAPSETNSAHPGSDREAVVAAYDEFWDKHSELRAQPESSWKVGLGEVSVDPQLRTTLQAMRFNEQRGITTYGEVSSRVSDVNINGDQATVVDCQDASRSGQADAETGKKNTVGVERNPVRARMRLVDGQWKVAEIGYPGGDC